MNRVIIFSILSLFIIIYSSCSLRSSFGERKYTSGIFIEKKGKLHKSGENQKESLPALVLNNKLLKKDSAAILIKTTTAAQLPKDVSEKKLWLKNDHFKKKHFGVAGNLPRKKISPDKKNRLFHFHKKIFSKKKGFTAGNNPKLGLLISFILLLLFTGLCLYIAKVTPSVLIAQFLLFKALAAFFGFSAIVVGIILLCFVIADVVQTLRSKPKKEKKKDSAQESTNSRTKKRLWINFCLKIITILLMLPLDISFLTGLTALLVLLIAIVFYLFVYFNFRMYRNACKENGNGKYTKEQLKGIRNAWIFNLILTTLVTLALVLVFVFGIH